MARRASIESGELLDRLSDTFRAVGYDGASLALLAEATGLKKASLYHRFPGGKEQMGREVLQKASSWLTRNVIEPLGEVGGPGEKVDLLVRRLDEFYHGGEKACLLNAMASPIAGHAPFHGQIGAMFDAFIGSLARLSTESGFSQEDAVERAERAVALIQGALVIARGTRSTAPFSRVLQHLQSELIRPLPTPQTAGQASAPA